MYSRFTRIHHSSEVQNTVKFSPQLVSGLFGVSPGAVSARTGRVGSLGALKGEKFLHFIENQRGIFKQNTDF